MVSPHMDDAVLSLGGLLFELNPITDCLVLTLNCADPDTDTAKLHDIAQPRLRRAEDREAMRILGCGYVQLGFLDAIYRRDGAGNLLYPTFNSVFLEPNPKDQIHLKELGQVLSKFFENLGRTIVFAPLGIGGHVDHRLAAQACLSFQSESVQVLLYEDFPYVADLGERLGIKDTPGQALERINVEEDGSIPIRFSVDKKIKMIHAYETQFEMLFGDKNRLKTLLNSTPEVLWKIKSITSKDEMDERVG